MSRTVSIFTLGILAVSALLAGCGEEPKDRTESKEDLGNAEATFDVDDVPSLNLPADQREAGKLWCKEHNRYEDECYLCHPELAPSPTSTPTSTPEQPSTKSEKHGPLST